MNRRTSSYQPNSRRVSRTVLELHMMLTALAGIIVAVGLAAAMLAAEQIIVSLATLLAALS